VGAGTIGRNSVGAAVVGATVVGVEVLLGIAVGACVGTSVGGDGCNVGPN
jgi:hypothetical protein